MQLCVSPTEPLITITTKRGINEKDARKDRRGRKAPRATGALVSRCQCHERHAQLVAAVTKLATARGKMLALLRRPLHMPDGHWDMASDAQQEALDAVLRWAKEQPPCPGESTDGEVQS